MGSARKEEKFHKEISESTVQLAFKSHLCVDFWADVFLPHLD